MHAISTLVSNGSRTTEYAWLVIAIFRSPQWTKKSWRWQQKQSGASVRPPSSARDTLCAVSVLFTCEDRKYNATVSFKILFDVINGLLSLLIGLQSPMTLKAPLNFQYNSHPCTNQQKWGRMQIVHAAPYPRLLLQDRINLYRQPRAKDSRPHL